jgi:GntR family transcriptional regulator
LAKRWGVAISTIRAAVGDLCAARVLTRIQGKGTFVARHDVARQQYYFSNIFDDTDQKAATSREIVSIKLITADDHTRSLLQLGGTRPPTVFVVTALLSLREAPAAVMTILLPEWLFPGFRKIGLNQTDENLYALYQRAFGVTVLRMEEKIYARVADYKTARTLRIRKGDPIMNVDRMSFSFNDVPVELRYRTFVGIRHYYVYKHEKLA